MPLDAKCVYRSGSKAMNSIHQQTSLEANLLGRQEYAVFGGCDGFGFLVVFAFYMRLDSSFWLFFVVVCAAVLPC